MPEGWVRNFGGYGTAQADTVADLADLAPSACAAFVESLGLPELKAKKLLAALGVGQQQVPPSTLRTAYSPVPMVLLGTHAHAPRYFAAAEHAAPARGPHGALTRVLYGPRMPTRARTQQGKAALCEGSSVLRSAQAACGGVL